MMADGPHGGWNVGRAFFAARGKLGTALSTGAKDVFASGRRFGPRLYC
jgi:hypothetical protein